MCGDYRSTVASSSALELDRDQWQEGGWVNREMEIQTEMHREAR